MSIPAAPDDFAKLWADAHAKFKESTGVDPLRDGLAVQLAGCKTSDDVLGKLDDEMKKFDDFRAEDSRWGRLRNDFIKPLLGVVLSVNDVVAEAASAVVRLSFIRYSCFFTILLCREFPAAGLSSSGLVCFFRCVMECVAFTAIRSSFLIQATKGVSDRYDALCELFEELRRYLDRLEVRLTLPGTLGPASRKVSVDILAHLLAILALARNLLKSKKRRLGRLSEHHWLLLVMAHALTPLESTTVRVCSVIVTCRTLWTTFKNLLGRTFMRL
jgi:hypothetical protein